MSAVNPRIPPPTQPKMTTFGLALDTDGKIWQYQGANGLVQIGVLMSGYPPQNVTPPLVTVVTNLNVGSTLGSNNGAWDNAPAAYARQWLRDGVAIAGATNTSYVLVAADVDHHISCQVIAFNTAGSTPAVSNAVGPVVP